MLEGEKRGYWRGTELTEYVDGVQEVVYEPQAAHILRLCFVGG